MGVLLLLASSSNVINCKSPIPPSWSMSYSVQAAVTKYHGLKHQLFLSHNWKPESKIRYRHLGALEKALSRLQAADLSLCPHKVEGRGSSTGTRWEGINRL